MSAIESYEFEHGWAIFVGSEGDSPDLFGLFPLKSDAEWVAKSRTADDDTLCDPCIVPAIVRDGKLLIANDFRVDTIKRLREVLATAGKESG